MISRFRRRRSRQRAITYISVATSSAAAKFHEEFGRRQGDLTPRERRGLLPEGCQRGK